ncbi:hypothetical protein Tco_1198058 [Tanacetum coccineum]
MGVLHYMIEFDGARTEIRASVKADGFVRHPFKLIDFNNLKPTLNKTSDQLRYRGLVLQIIYLTPIDPLPVLPPSPVLPLSPMFDSRDFFPPKEISPPKDTKTPVESPIPISPSSSVGSSSPVRSTTPPPDYPFDESIFAELDNSLWIIPRPLGSEPIPEEYNEFDACLSVHSWKS